MRINPGGWSRRETAATMSSLGKFSLLPVLLLCLLVLQESATTEAAVPEFELVPYNLVEIFNRLPNGESFTIHCKSADDDLGVHVIAPGQSSKIRFRTNFFQTTLFFCGVKWKGGHIEFDIFDAKRDEVTGRCNPYCKWEARGDAIVGFDDSTPVPDISIPWKK